MIEFQRTSRVSKKVNLTALVDMVFQLVIFFMLTTSFVQTGTMELNFAEGEIAVSEGKTDSLLVRVLDNKRVEINDKKFTFNEFSQKLFRIISEKPKKDVIIVAERPVTVQGLITIMDIANRAGAINVTLAQ